MLAKLILININKHLMKDKFPSPSPKEVLRLPSVSVGAENNHKNKINKK